MNSTFIGWALRTFGLLLIALAVVRGIRGRYVSENSIGMDETLDRSRQPVRFWAQLAIQAILGAVLALGVVQV